MDSRLRPRHLLLAVTLSLAATSSASAQVIVSPINGTINVGGPGSGQLSHTFDQSGLSIGFTSGVTDFASYIALNPMHTFVFDGFEWFSEQGTSAAVVTYDLGLVRNLFALALWNEESSGIGRLNVLGSVDGSAFFDLALGIMPVDVPFSDYPAQVFNFAAQNARYVRFEMSECPQPNPGNFAACAIGEVAFAAAATQQVVPEPMTMVLLGTGLLGIGGAARRRRRDAEV